MEKRFLSVKELGEYLGIAPQTIYNKINQGNFPIPCKKILGRVKWERKEVDAFLSKLPSHNACPKNN